MLRLKLLGIISLFLTCPLAHSKMICEDSNLYDAAWGMSPNAHRIFTSDLSEPANSRLSKDQKRAAVKRAIERYHSGAGGYTSEQIARAIVWAADCTGNDFKWFAAVVGNESLYCSTRLGSGGDSGCGQFTTPALISLKLQMKLPSRPRGNVDTASPRSTQAMKEMVSSCYQRYDGMVDGSQGPGSEALFYNVLDKDISSIKNIFQRASAMHVDILATAIFLKFNVALAGGYTVPGSAMGGIARYNGGGVSNYLSHIQKQRGYIQSNFMCVEDTYTISVEAAACDLEEDREACLDNLENKYSNEQVDYEI